MCQKVSKGSRKKKTFLEDMPAKGSGGGAKPLSATKMQVFVVGKKCMTFSDFDYNFFLRLS